jgi:hypothetical protein
MNWDSKSSFDCFFYEDHKDSEIFYINPERLSWTNESTL